MKRIFIIVFLFSGLYVRAQNPDSLFRKANDFYQKGRFEQAIDLYLKIDSMGYYSANLYYNTGNAYFRSNKLGKARLYYEKAILLKPNNEDIKSNISYTRSMLTDRFDEVPELFFIRWYKGMIAWLKPGTWTLISMILFLACMTGFFFYIFTRKITLRRSGFYTGMVLFIFSLITLAFAAERDSQINHPGTAVIMSPSQTVKSAPRESGKDLFVLHEGALVKVESKLNGWNEVMISDGRKGWIPVSSLEEVKPI